GAGGGNDPVSGNDVKVAYAWETQPRPNTGWTEKLRFTFDPGTHYPYGRGVIDGAIHRLVRKLNEFDLVWFFKQRSADMFPNRAWQRSVLDVDDLQSTYDRTAFRIGSFVDRIKSLRGLYIWRRREALLGKRFSVLTVCSEEDREYLKNLGVRDRVHVIPNGCEKPSGEPRRNPVTPPRIGFIGGFDHLPNREGISWFVKKCWPAIKREVPQARLRLIGRDPGTLRDLRGQDVDPLDWLPDPSAEIQSWFAMIVPIRFGAGTRVKIAQAFSQKCPIVSTSLGTFGYGAMDGREMYVADSAQEFSRACVRAICEPEEANRMAQRAWIEFLNKWAWEAIRPRIWAAAEDCLRLSGRQWQRSDGMASVNALP
ncbi:MAG TPA: glycosyltransferase family 4 protein, partial [Terriglobales bacterium]|nr:glycosyltransferase family 4 protein [Terriglobales bacterium]